jgi:hypothetical protein
MHRLRWVAGLIVASALALPATATATWGNKCSLGNNQHCYAIASWLMSGTGNGGGEEVKGMGAEIATTGMNVPQWENGDFVTNEEWMSEPRGWWEEDGQIAGYNLWTEEGREVNCCSLHWFYASDLNGFLVYVAPWTYPGWTYINYHINDPGNDGRWCSTIGSVEVGESCRSGFTKYATAIELGMEAADEQQPQNAGLDNSTAAQWRDGSWHNWSRATVETVHYSGANESAYVCAKNWNPAPGFIKWGTPNNVC